MTTTPRKPADHRPKKTAAKKPDPSVNLDLKVVAAEFRRAEEENPVAPFTFNHPTGEGVFTLPHPSDMDLIEVEELAKDPIGNVSVLVRALGKEQVAELKKMGGLPAKFLERIIDAWYSHYGIDIEQLGKSEG